MINPHKLRILIVDDDRRMAHTLTDILQFKGFEALAVHSGEEALKALKEKVFDCLLTDMRMSGMDGITLYRHALEINPEILCIFMTAYASDEILQLSASTDALGILDKPLDINHLLGFFSSLREERTIAIVDDDPVFCEALSELLQKRGFSTTVITDPHAVMQHIDESIHVVLLDLKLNQITGLDVLEHIRKRYPNMPVIIITAYSQEMMPAIRAAKKINAFTFLTKPLEMEELDRALAELYKLQLQRNLKWE